MSRLCVWSVNLVFFVVVVLDSFEFLFCFEDQIVITLKD